MAKVDIHALADPQDIFMARAAPAIMAAIAMFPSTSEALRMLLVLIARQCDVTGSYQFLGGSPSDDEVLQKIGACLQEGCKSFADAEAVFNNAVASVNSVINLNGPSIPSVTPSPAPHQPSPAPTSNGVESIDDIVEREVRKALSKASLQAPSSAAAQAYATKTGTTTLSGAVTSHGPGHDPIISTRTVEVLENANYHPYRWSPTAGGDLPGKFRAILISMASLLTKRRGTPFDAVTEWARRGTEHVRVPPTEFILLHALDMNTQEYIEFAACLITGNMAIYGSFIAARLEDTDPTYITQYASGTQELESNPFFGISSSTFYGPHGRGGRVKRRNDTDSPKEDVKEDTTSAKEADGKKKEGRAVS